MEHRATRVSELETSNIDHSFIRSTILAVVIVNEESMIRVIFYLSFSTRTVLCGIIAQPCETCH